MFVGNRNFSLNQWICLAFVCLLGGLSSPFVFAYDVNDVTVKANETPKELVGVGLTDKTGDQLTMDTSFVDQEGKTTNLGEILATDGKPAILSVVYYGCHNLCNFHLDGVIAALNQINWTVGKDFHLIAVSMDPRETPVLAKEKMLHYQEQYQRPGGQSGWHFLTGTEENIKKVTSQLGFAFRWNEDEGQWAHASSAYLITPQGKISRSLPGIAFDPSTLKLGIQEASSNRIGSVIDQLILYCYKFDPKKNKFTIYAFNLMRIAGLITVLVMAIFLIPLWIRESRRGKTA